MVDVINFRMIFCGILFVFDPRGMEKRILIHYTIKYPKSRKAYETFSLPQNEFTKILPQLLEQDL